MTTNIKPEIGIMDLVTDDFGGLRPNPGNSSSINIQAASPHLPWLAPWARKLLLQGAIVIGTVGLVVTAAYFVACLAAGWID